MSEKRTDIEWNDYLSFAYAEGFCEGANASPVEIIEAWSYITKNKLFLILEEEYAKRIYEFIEIGMLNKEGDINWNVFDEIVRRI